MGKLLLRMRILLRTSLHNLLRRSTGAAAMTWALVFMLAVLAALSCLTIVGRLAAG